MKKYKLVTSLEDIKEFLTEISNSEFVCLDVESTGLNVRKDTIVGVSVSPSIAVSYYFPFYEWRGFLGEIFINNKSVKDIFKNILFYYLKDKKLIFHNASYDVRIIKNNLGINLIDKIYCDTLLLFHTIYEDGVKSEKPFGLKDISRVFEHKIKISEDEELVKNVEILKENVKSKGGSILKNNLEIYKADLQILSDYACEDTDLTLRLFFYFSKFLVWEGLESFFYDEEVMPLYKEVTIPMEEKGLKVDLELLESMKNSIEIDMEIYRKKVLDYLLDQKETSQYLENISKENYPPSNRGSFAQELLNFFKVEGIKKTSTGAFSLIEKEINKITFEPLKEFLLCSNSEKLLKLYPDLFKNISLYLYKKNIEEDYINIQSNKQLSTICFEYFNFKPLSETEKGSPQFNEEFIDSQKNIHDWFKDLYVYKKLLKMKSSYIDRFIENNEDGILYFYYKQHGTISGRYSSDAQQLPRVLDEDAEPEEILRKYNREIRAFFISRENKVFVDTDYESLEPHIFAHVSNDPNLIDIFLKGEDDFYSTIAIKAEKIQNVSPNKKADNYLKKVNPSARQKAKSYCLGVPYGMKEHALAKELKIDKKEAKSIIYNYLEGFPNLKKWMEFSERGAKIKGYVQSELGRKRHLNDVKILYEKFGDKLLDPKEIQILIKKYDRDNVLNAERAYTRGLNNAKNFQIQSLAASIVNRAMVKINRALKNLGIEGLVVAQFHDQIVVEVEELKKIEAKNIIKDIFLNIYNLKTVLKAEPEFAYNLRDGH